MRTSLPSKPRYSHAFRASSLRLGFLCLLLSGLAFAGCKQGEGETCQVDSDCEEGLVCVPGISVCQEPGGTADIADAAPRADADTTDGAIADADIGDADITDAAVSDAAPDATITQ